MTKQQAIAKSIAHWKRMIAFAKKQNPKRDCNSLSSAMLHKTGETWGGAYCSLCDKYYNCYNCPLHVESRQCVCCIEWEDVSVSETVKDWLSNAKVMLKKLRSLQKPKRKGKAK